MPTATDVLRIELHMPTIHHAEQILPFATMFATCACMVNAEWAVNHEHVTLIAAAVAATDEWPATAGHV